MGTDRELLAACDRFSGHVYRCTRPEHAAARELVSGAGSLHHAGRWLAKGTTTVVYASLEPEHAVAEGLASVRYYGLRVEAAMPRVLSAIEVALECVLDLRLAASCTALEIDMSDMLHLRWRDHASEAPSQAAGRRCFKAGIEALLVPSARSPGTNLVVFTTNVRPGSLFSAAVRT